MDEPRAALTMPVSPQDLESRALAIPALPVVAGRRDLDPGTDCIAHSESA
jgi:hypothetical protein